MADENQTECPEAPACPECPAPGAPAWMATFSDLVTLLLTFFILLYAMSKQDVHKFESVAGSIRKAFAGNAMKIGETVQLGKSPDDTPTMIENQEPIEPFPIDLLTTEGFLDKYEFNRESDEDMLQMKKDLEDYELVFDVNMYQMPEGIKVRVKDKILFENGSTKIDKISMRVFERMIKLMKNEDWVLFVEGYSDPDEKGTNGEDSYSLSSRRTNAVIKSLAQRGVRPDRMTGVYYGDSRSTEKDNYKKVEFLLRKRDLRTKGREVGTQ